MKISSSVLQFFTLLSEYKGVVDQGHYKQHNAEIAHKKLCNALMKSVTSLKQDKPKNSPFDNEIKHLLGQVEQSLHTINKTQQGLKHSIAVQKEHQDKLILLIFGKVNAGKSSFSNYLVEICKAALNTEEARYFYFKEGKKIPIDSSFKEGCTETTAQIQGVEIGNLLLLDSPGLHSTTEENGALTKEYSDSADLILWLTSSNSPGQTQELNELKLELSKGKILFPVITKSDSLKEEEVLDKGLPDIVSILTMKDKSTQQCQQDDVYKRALNKLATLDSAFKNKQLKKPVSISTHYAQNNIGQDEILETAGIQSLFAGLNDFYQQAIELKKNNIEQQIIHSIEKVNTYLSTETLHHFESLNSNLKQQREKVQGQTGAISQTVLNQVNVHILPIVSKHEKTQDIQAIQTEVNALITRCCNEQFEHLFDQLFQNLNKATLKDNKGINITAGFSTEHIEYEEYLPSKSKSLLDGLVSIGKTLITQPSNTYIKVGVEIVSDMISDKKTLESHTVSEVIGIDSKQLEDNIKTELATIIPDLVANTAKELMTELNPLQNIVNDALQHINDFNKD